MKLFSLVIAFLLSATIVKAQTPESAQDILNAAEKKATAEKKNIIVLFHASWCGWCHKMDTALNDATVKKFFDKNYVITHITVQENKKNKGLENPGGEEFNKKYHGDQAGLPFWLILDASGNLLGDSFIRPDGVGLDKAGDNIGCPASEKEVAIFVALLKKTSTLKDKQLKLIATRFRKNEAAN
jgi:thiol-disulfide isomerase/thioredoxin